MDLEELGHEDESWSHIDLDMVQCWAALKTQQIFVLRKM
jgi:hypothetical protein